MLVSVGDSEHGAETTREVEKVKEKKKKDENLGALYRCCCFCGLSF